MIQIKSSALRAIAKLDAIAWRRIVKRIDALAENPAVGIRLKGEFAGLWRVREGDYSIIYELRQSEVTVLVLRVARRRELYR